MTREEAIERLKNIKSVPSMFIDEITKELVEFFKQPSTLEEFLGWQEGEEYKWQDDILMLENGKIYSKSDKCSSGWCNYTFYGDNVEDLRRAKKAEPKPKAWRVRDLYSYNCLIKELKEQGYRWVNGAELTEVHDFNSDFINLIETNHKILKSHREDLPNDLEVIEYHKVEPRYLLQTDLTSENGIQYLSFDKKRRKYFLGALIASDNVQQKFTDDEITKIKAITKFAKLCEKIKVER